MISPDSFRIAAFVYYITKNDFPEWLFAKKTAFQFREVGWFRKSPGARPVTDLKTREK